MRAVPSPADQSDQSLHAQRNPPTRRSRRAVLAAIGAGCATLAGCSSVTDLAGATYERSDLELTIGTACRSDGSDTTILRLSWTWAGGDGGSEPADLVVLEWPDEHWTLVTAEYDTTETVRFDGKGVVDGMEGVRFEHDDAAAEAGTTYAASCELSARDDAGGDGRTVFGRFAHVSEEASGPREGGWFGDVDAAWTAMERDRDATLCGDGA